jgi:hypothetical protein
MKTLILLLAAAVSASAATTIDPANKSAYGANIAWINFQGDVANGAVVSQTGCTGFIWAANCGWINLGDGSPGANCVVNLDAAGNLSGFAYGANIGWLNFHPFGQPKIDLLTGKFSGHIWSANCGWISLSNAFAHVQTTVILPGEDSDKDGLPDAWELRFARTLDVLEGTGDPDGDGVSNLDEALADTNPLDANDALRITQFVRNAGGDFTIQWKSQHTRLYRLLSRPAFDPLTPWQDSGFGLMPPEPGAETAATFSDPGGAHSFFRIEAIKPLSP